MSEGVRTAPSSDAHAKGGAIAAIVLGAATAIGGWQSPVGGFAQNTLFLCAAGLVIAGAVMLVLRQAVHGPRDYYGGLALIAMAMFAVWASNDLPGMHGFAFGPGTAPRIFASVLVFMGAVVAIIGMFAEGAGLEHYAFRGPFFITIATIVFAFTIRSFGLVISSMVSILISAAGSPETRWIETAIWAAVLTGFCSLLFPYALNLPMPLWPSPNISLATMFSIR
jgi:putative tricarboxylic transport membrane protein